jgi:hypothetical protein
MMVKNWLQVLSGVGIILYYIIDTKRRNISPDEEEEFIIWMQRLLGNRYVVYDQILSM